VAATPARSLKLTTESSESTSHPPLPIGSGRRSHLDSGPGGSPPPSTGNTCEQIFSLRSFPDCGERLLSHKVKKLNTRIKNSSKQNFELKIVYPKKQKSDDEPVRKRLSTENVYSIRKKSWQHLRSYIIENKKLNETCPVLFDGEVNKISNTSFRRTTFENKRRIFVNYTKGNTQRIDNCDFSRAVFIGGIENVEFIDCDFQGAKFDKAKFRNVVFMNCNFTGTLFSLEIRDKGDDPDSSMFRNSYNWDKVDRSRVKYDKNAKGMNPDRAKKARLNNKKRKSKKKKGIDLKKIRG
jgi:hypothetical protein